MTTKTKFFIYCRKSTDDKTGKRQVTSLDAQRREMRELCKRENLWVVEVFEESKSAKQPGRPVFNDMLNRIERGEASGILCWDIDRLYRNPVDEGRVRWLLQGGTIAQIKTPTRSYSPHDAGLLIAVEGGRATDFIIHLKDNVARGVREKLLRGEWAGSSRPVGYIYDRDRRNIVPDPKRAKIVELVYREFSEGRRGLTAMSDRLAQFGIRNRSGKTWSKSQVHSFFTNRLYTGVMVWNDETFEGKFKPIVPAELFEKVQGVLKDRSKPRKVRNGHNFPYCGLFRCTCGSMMSAQWATGNGGTYRYYRCTRKTQECFEPYVQEGAVSDQILAAIKPLAISSAEAATLRALIDEKAEKDSLSLMAGNSEILEKMSAIQQKLNKLTRGFLDEVIDEESYQAAKADLVHEKNRLKQEKERLHRTRTDFWNEPAKEVVNALEMAGKVQTEKSPQEISKLVQKFGTNRLISRKTVSFNFSEPYQFTLSFLGKMRVSDSQNASSISTLPGENSESIKWCPG